MSRLAVTITMVGVLVLLGSHPVSAYVWKCTTPQGEIWTSLPSPSDDCQEYDEQYNSSAVPPVASSLPPSTAFPPVVTVPTPSPYVGTYVYPPYYPPYYYAPGYSGPGAVIIRPLFGYPHRGFYGGHWHGGHFRR